MANKYKQVNNDTVKSDLKEVAVAEKASERGKKIAKYLPHLTAYEKALLKKYYTNPDGTYTDRGVLYIVDMGSKHMTGKSQFQRDMDRIGNTMGKTAAIGTGLGITLPALTYGLVAAPEAFIGGLAGSNILDKKVRQLTPYGSFGDMMSNIIHGNSENALTYEFLNPGGFVGGGLGNMAKPIVSPVLNKAVKGLGNVLRISAMPVFNGLRPATVTVGNAVRAENAVLNNAARTLNFEFHPIRGLKAMFGGNKPKPASSSSSTPTGGSNPAASTSPRVNTTRYFDSDGNLIEMHTVDPRYADDLENLYAKSSVVSDKYYTINRPPKVFTKTEEPLFNKTTLQLVKPEDLKIGETYFNGNMEETPAFTEVKGNLNINEQYYGPDGKPVTIIKEAKSVKPTDKTYTADYEGNLREDNPYYQRGSSVPSVDSKVYDAEGNLVIVLKPTTVTDPLTPNLYSLRGVLVTDENGLLNFSLYNSPHYDARKVDLLGREYVGEGSPSLYRARRAVKNPDTYENRRIIQQYLGKPDELVTTPIPDEAISRIKRTARWINWPVAIGGTAILTSKPVIKGISSLWNWGWGNGSSKEQPAITTPETSAIPVIDTSAVNKELDAGLSILRLYNQHVTDSLNQNK